MQGWHCETGISPPVNFFTDHSKVVLLLWIICVIYVLCFSCFCVFFAAFWSPAWKGLTSWPLFVMLNCVFTTLPCGILGQVWFLIVSIPDLCCFSYFLSPSTESISIEVKPYTTFEKTSVIFFDNEKIQKIKLNQEDTGFVDIQVIF